MPSQAIGAGQAVAREETASTLQSACCCAAEVWRGHRANVATVISFAVAAVKRRSPHWFSS